MENGKIGIYLLQSLSVKGNLFFFSEPYLLLCLKILTSYRRSEFKFAQISSDSTLPFSSTERFSVFWLITFYFTHY